MTVRIDTEGSVLVVTIDRPQARNAIDADTAAALHDAFLRFDRDDAFAVAVLTGAGGCFCAGAGLKAFAAGGGVSVRPGGGGPGPLGATRLGPGTRGVA